MRLTSTDPVEIAPGKWQFTVNLPAVMVPGQGTRYPKTQKTSPVFLDAKGRPVGKREGKRLAEDFRQKTLEAMEQHDTVDPAVLTFAEMTDRWLAAEEMEEEYPIQPVTIDFYRTNLTRYILPKLGTRVAAEVRPTDLAAFYADQRTRLAAGTVKHMKRTISASYAWAIEAGLQDVNPALTTRRKLNRAKRHTPPTKTLTTWTPAQIAKAVQAARGRLVLLPTMFGGWCGLRRGEICGMRWQDLDLDAGSLSVGRTIEQVGKTLHVSPPKSAAGYRTVSMPDALCDALRAQQAVYRGLRVCHGEGWNPEGYVVFTARGTPVKPRNLSSAWSDFCRTKHLPAIRLHDLRHSYATDLILRQGVDVREVATMLGHSDPAFTLRTYTHPDDAMREATGKALNERVTAALAKAEADSRLVRDNVVPLHRAAV